MNKYINLIGTILTLAVCAAAAAAQTGGVYTIHEKTISSGGGVTTDSPNNIFAVYGVIGQPVAGPAARNGAVGVSSGMLSGVVLPTAAGVSVVGRVMTPEGRGLTNAVVTITAPDGTTSNAITSRLGNFRFADVETGQTYVISVRSRRFSFTPQVVSVTDNLTGIDFVGQ